LRRKKWKRIKRFISEKECQIRKKKLSREERDRRETLLLFHLRKKVFLKPKFNGEQSYSTMKTFLIRKTIE